ncbi:hypothetical protein HGP17_10565 [Rhizobium sp. P38BS-XIX]|uniref:hypothetical protein n=1 Tax=Rhizobium sp. P38BS-XIX TaxID=2726740 RepID=UPI0014575D4E|nr:hypothetical protein [Rhizobium sp. P38BS-XIX]NLR97274.1 hypothetical protein [Rhizobium sp. P38BS-XIX]
MAAPRDPDFREALLRWARKFVGSDVAAIRIVERTINVLCNNPELLDVSDVNEAVFALLRRHAFDEIERLPGVPLGSTSTERDDEPAL